ncbi:MULTISPECIES: hypothetical protein [Pseudomonas]|uniref:hypothetical protein n=1 Tax=Pseudomonas TaxID=286 RepID=UPI001C2F92C8|nr:MULTISPECIES: hypothetical protein [Pseudomonas]MBV2081960.1 hypothetical protein [Pseudomonas carnis]MBV2087845.1 hypothetical protein [Pseudomonas carnis]MDO3691754.1 hypothetical protein [Pseudomonas sp. DKN 2791]MDO7033473.1 hypothetical protein [Pseudomonas sp. DKN 2792]
MTQLITDLKKSLGNLKKQTEALGETITTIRDRIMRLEAEQATILDRPLCKADFLEICLARLDCAAQAGDMRWVEYFTHQAQDKFLGRALRNSIREMRGLQQGQVTSLSDSYLSFDEPLPPGHNPLTVDVVCSLFREPIKEAIRRQFDQMEWPFPDAQPGAAYFPRLDEIELELTELKTQEAMLVDGTEQLGVPLPKPYEVGGNRYS